MFGIYQFCQKLSVYGGLTNLGATSFLKIRLASLRGTTAPEPKKTAIGVCLSQWVLMLPIAVVLCLLGARFISGGNQLPALDFWAVVAILGLVPLSHVLSIPNVALFASNLGYKGAIVAPLTTFVGAALSVGSLYAGFGLPGIAASLFCATALGALMSWNLAKTHLPWFGARSVSTSEVVSTMRSSLGAAGASIGYLGLQQLENLTVGAVFGPEMLGKLVVTGVAAHFIELIVKQFVNASTPSVSLLITGEHRRRLDRVRGEAYRYIMVCYVLAAPPVILLSEAFVTAWVGREAFISTEVVAFLLVAGALRLMALVDAVMLDQVSDFFAKTLMAFLVVATPLVLAAFSRGGDRSINYWCGLILLVMFLNTAVVHRRSSRRFSLSLSVTTLMIPSLAAAVCVLVWSQMALSSRPFSSQLLSAVMLQACALAALLAAPVTRSTIFDLGSRLARFARELRDRRG